MKLTHFLNSMLLASLVYSLTIIPATYATSPESTSDAQVIIAPSKTELETAITAVKNLPGYQTYAPYAASNYYGITEDQTPLFREYRYLVALVREAESIINNFYDLTKPEDLQLLQRSLKDAVTSFTLIYNAHMKQNYPSQAPSASLSTDTSNEAVNTPKSAPKNSNTSPTVAQAQTTPDVIEASESTLTATTSGVTTTTEIIPENTNDPDTSSLANQTANLMAHTATAGTTFAALGFIAIKNRNKRYLS